MLEFTAHAPSAPNEEYAKEGKRAEDDDKDELQEDAHRRAGVLAQGAGEVPDEFLVTGMQSSLQIWLKLWRWRRGWLDRRQRHDGGFGFLQNRLHAFVPDGSIGIRVRRDLGNIDAGHVFVLGGKRPGTDTNNLSVKIRVCQPRPKKCVLFYYGRFKTSALSKTRQLLMVVIRIRVHKKLRHVCHWRIG